jgi:DNA primase
VAGRIRQEDVDAVRARSDIVKVISEHLQLKKAGGDRFVGLCPFHPEKTASFSVSPSKQAYYCFGCTEGGDLFRFIQKIENLSFTEAVERLASQAGITLRYEGESKADRRTAGRRQVLHRAIAEAARLYYRMLLDGREGAEARAYLAERGLTKESAERFEIGYAPGYPDFLLKRLTRSYSAEVLVEAGLVSKDAEGNLRDRFRGRVMFPIHDLSGNAVGFGGRLLAGPRAPQNAAKYVNSAESPVYHKGSLLYNLNRAKPDITRSGRTFLVEGYTDVIALDQVGVREAVATCGTALGEDHIRLLSRFTERMVLAFDSDEAGARAAERAFAFHERYPVDLSVLVLPEGQDPADFALANGEQAGERFEALLEGAVPLVAYMIERSLTGRPLEHAEDKARAVKAALPHVAGLQDPVLRERYAAVLAERVGVSVNAVLLELDREAGAPGAPADAAAPSRVSPAQKVEREALKLLVQAPHLTVHRLGELRTEHFSIPTHQKAFELIRETTDAPPGAIIGRAQQAGEQVERLIARLAIDSLELFGDPGPQYADQLFFRLEEFLFKRQADEIRGRLEKLNPLKVEEEYAALYDQFVRLEGARRQAREAAEAVGSSL